MAAAHRSLRITRQSRRLPRRAAARRGGRLLQLRVGVGPTARIARGTTTASGAVRREHHIDWRRHCEGLRPQDFRDRAWGILLRRAGRRPSWGLPILLLQQRTG